MIEEAIVAAAYSYAADHSFLEGLATTFKAAHRFGQRRNFVFESIGPSHNPGERRAVQCAG